MSWMESIKNPDTSTAASGPAVVMTDGSEFQLAEGQELGSGGYGKVVHAIQVATGERVAAKLIPLNRMKRHAVEKEVKLMALLKDCPYIVGLRGISEDHSRYIVYMDLADHGELFSRVISAGCLQEREAQPWFQHLILGVQHMHTHGITHRDLKLENILLDGKDIAKICDFGLAHQYATLNGKVEVTTLREVCGSKSYCAPEVLESRGYEGFPADVWSCGICLFAMLAGFFPLDEASGSDWRFGRVKQAAAAGMSACHTIYGFYDRPCDLSNQARDLIDGMLRISPKERLTVSEILDSPWLKQGAMPSSTTYEVAGDYDGRPNYRGAADEMSMDELQKILAADAQTPTRPVYRGDATGKDGPAPPLLKQNGMSRLREVE